MNLQIIHFKNIKTIMNDFYKIKIQIEQFDRRFKIIFSIAFIFVILVFIMTFLFNIFVLYNTFK